MILHLGGDVIIPLSDVIAIVDFESVETSKDTKEFLKIAAEEGFVRKITDDPPKSFILAEIDKKSVVYFSPISSVTLLKRSGFIEDIGL